MCPSTIWLASYPKSGNTWMRLLLDALQGDEDGFVDDHGVRELGLARVGSQPFASSRAAFEQYTGLVASDLTSGEQRALRPMVDDAVDDESTRPWFRRIHDALLSGAHESPIVGLRATRGAVYIVRDPRDVAVSFAHHVGRDHGWAVQELGNPRAALAASSRSTIRQLPQSLSTWSEHVRSWLDHELFTTLVVRYEDMQAAPARELTRVAEFAGLDATADDVLEAVRMARFDRLQRHESDHGFLERPPRSERFFRRGIAGAWRDELEPQLADRIVAEHADMMVRLGYSVDSAAPRRSSCTI